MLLHCNVSWLLQIESTFPSQKYKYKDSLEKGFNQHLKMVPLLRNNLLKIGGFQKVLLSKVRPFEKVHPTEKVQSNLARGKRLVTFLAGWMTTKEGTEERVLPLPLVPLSSLNSTTLHNSSNHVSVTNMFMNTIWLAQF